MAVTAASIRARRRAASPAALQKKREEGTLRGDERAFVRVGASASMVLAGEDDLSEWSDEELKRGMRCVQAGPRKGRFIGKPPVVVPKKLHDELVRRTLSKANMLMLENSERAVQVLVAIVDDETIDAKDRLVAVRMILDRVMGKAPERIDFSVSGDPEWLQALRGGIVSVENEADVIDVDDDQGD